MSTTVVVARMFRNTRLFLVSSKPREFTWSANRDLAMPVSVAVACRLMIECEDFERGTEAFAIDKNDCLIVAGTEAWNHAEGRKALSRTANRNMRKCAHPAGCEMLAAPGDIYCADCASDSHLQDGTYDERN